MVKPSSVGLGTVYLTDCVKCHSISTRLMVCHGQQGIAVPQPQRNALCHSSMRVWCVFALSLTCHTLEVGQTGSY